MSRGGDWLWRRLLPQLLTLAPGSMPSAVSTGTATWLGRSRPTIRHSTRGRSARSYQRLGLIWTAQLIVQGPTLIAQLYNFPSPPPPATMTSQTIGVSRRAVGRRSPRSFAGELPVLEPAARPQVRVPGRGPDLRRTAPTEGGTPTTPRLPPSSRQHTTDGRCEHPPVGWPAASSAHHLPPRPAATVTLVLPARQGVTA